MQHVSRSGRPYPNIVHNVQSPALKQTIRPQEWLCHSRLRMVQSLQITGMKQNVLFLQRARMQKLINGSMRNVSLSGERGGPSDPRRMVESRIHHVKQKEWQEYDTPCFFIKEAIRRIHPLCLCRRHTDLPY